MGFLFMARIIVYIDGSNFYHLSKLNFNKFVVDFSILINLIKKSDEEIIKIKYFNSPLNKQEEPLKYSEQMKFFDKLKKTPLMELDLGKLVKRPINKINVFCPNCGLKKIDNLSCPSCKREISIDSVYKASEKGVDVKIALGILVDALNDEYDSAFLISGDSDFIPAIDFVQSKLNKKVIYCRFPKPKTRELMNVCSETRIITQDIITNSRPEKR